MEEFIVLGFSYSDRIRDVFLQAACETSDRFKQCKPILCSKSAQETSIVPEAANTI